MQQPKAAKHPVTRSFHGRDFVDDYEWMRDKDNPETIAYLEAENAYTQEQTAHLTELTDAIYGEIKSRVKETDMSVPQRQGDWWYYGRTEESKDYGISCRVRVDDSTDPWTAPTLPADGSGLPGEQTILDGNALAEGHDFFSMGASSVTTSGRYLAYSVDTAGDERFDLRIKDLETDELLGDVIPGVFYGATWAGENYLFYTRVDDAWRPHQIWRHRRGTDAADDVLVYQEDDEKFGVAITADRSERYLFLIASSTLTSENRVLPMSDPEGEFQLLWPREPGVEYFVDLAVLGGAGDGGDAGASGGREHWVITHNAHGPNFAVGTCRVPDASGAVSSAAAGALPPLRELDELIAHDDERRIEGTDVYRDFMFLAYRRGGIGRLAVADLTGDATGDATGAADGGFGEFRELKFSEELYTAGLGGHPEWDTPVVRVTYGSYTQPSQVLDYRVSTGEFTWLKEQEVEGGYDPSDYIAQRMWATAADGTKVPMSVVRRRDVEVGVDKHKPCLLYGYGSYEASMDPGFSVARLSLLDRGMVWVCAHVRGGGEMGRLWYDHGKGLEKMNTFTDFIACADTLVEAGVTSYDQLVAEGGSAGGMLMGAVANLAPEKFAGIQAIVPFVDPLTSILMPELPLTVGEWEEWGDPYHDPEVYDYMAAYAPYENIEPKDYPDILAVTSINDTRVLYVEPAKWIAKLRDTATGGHFLLKTEMAAGHGGVSGRYAKWKQTAFEYAWTLATAGAVETSDAAETAVE
ncbi:S9 family peptidase [Corynebacterium sp. CCUG 70398]|uniref:S9 family peptidase n=1 Tax=Corynebacterium sp. CCUG 70398 TaxID=2823891 RepID=UPI00210A68AD|nr:S9 family peptidase [Corynebacterium sp. CCUG 70398]MCQ4623553.1 S9 family peptidase [Corynebacterium sp. CCUG 70398]